ncbi:MAG TPA: DNA-directed RNA polymerase subunit omega [Pseudomonadales bacterium]|jgi:DNA-directed RNA polymerase subunit omega
MARITVEDCLDNVENRFELVLLAAKRARQLQTGGKEPLVAEDGDKPSVLSLREIAANLITPSNIEELAADPETDDTADLAALIKEMDLNSTIVPEEDEDDEDLA